MSRDTIPDKLAYSVTCFPLIAAIFIQEAPANAGWLEIGGRRLVAEPFFILSGAVGTLETVARAFFALIAYSCLCLIPASDFKNSFKKKVVDELYGSTCFNLGLTAYSITSIATNVICMSEDGKTFEDCSNSLAACCGTTINF